MSPLVERFVREAVRSFEAVNRTRPDLCWRVEITSGRTIVLRASIVHGSEEDGSARLLSAQRAVSYVEIEARGSRGAIPQFVIDTILSQIGRESRS